MSDDLKPCPFCGCTLVDCDDVTDNNGNLGWHVYCPQCFCDGPGMDCKADAIAAWNRRASDAEIERLRAVLVEARDDVGSWGAYASPYFQEKWDLEGNIARIDAALSPLPAKKGGTVD